jgi:hypothetical protein
MSIRLWLRLSDLPPDGLERRTRRRGFRWTVRVAGRCSSSLEGRNTRRGRRRAVPTPDKSRPLLASATDRNATNVPTCPGHAAAFLLPAKRRLRRRSATLAQDALRVRPAAIGSRPLSLAMHAPAARRLGQPELVRSARPVGAARGARVSRRAGAPSPCLRLLGANGCCCPSPRRAIGSPEHAIVFRAARSNRVCRT